MKNAKIDRNLTESPILKNPYDAVIGIGNIHIQLYKIEAQRELQITWSEVARNSGGEGFLSACSLLSAAAEFRSRWTEACHM